MSSSPAQEGLGVNDSTVHETNSSSTGRNDGFQREQPGDIEIPDEINNNFLPLVVPGSEAPALTPGVLTENQTFPSRRVDRPTFVPSELPLHAMVPLKKREQSWRGEFVELSALEDEEPDDILFNTRKSALRGTYTPG